MPLNDIDLFVLDLMMSCRSRMFYAWGTSGVPWFIAQCRKKFAEQYNLVGSMGTVINGITMNWSLVNIVMKYFDKKNQDSINYVGIGNILIVGTIIYRIKCWTGARDMHQQRVTSTSTHTSLGDCWQILLEVSASRFLSFRHPRT